MSSVINNFNIFRGFPTNLKQNVKSFYVSTNNKIVYDLGYCVLNDNKVYGFGRDIHKCLGYNKGNENYVLISELCDKNIEEFYHGLIGSFMFARNNQNQIFSWGHNVFGQLARGFISEYDKYLSPDLVGFFEHKKIIDISCGGVQCLALSSEALIYRWGQVYKQDEKIYSIQTPGLIDLTEKVKFIRCSFKNSFFVTFDGNCYYYGFYRRNSIETQIKLDDSIKIKSILNANDCGKIYCLSFNGIIYEFSEKINWDELEILGEGTPKLCLNKFFDLNQFCKNNEQFMINQFKDLYINFPNEIIIETEQSVYAIKNSQVENTCYKTLFEYLLFEKQTTHKTIHIIGNELFVISNEKFEENSKDFRYTVKPIYSNDDNFTNERISSLIKFRIFNDLPQILDNNVKYFYQSKIIHGDYFGYFVMDDDSVYCVGDNYFGKLGLGHTNRVYNCTEIIELKDHNIQEFYNGYNSFMFARNNKNQIFSWGNNEYGQLARGFISGVDECLKPLKIDFFDDKNIIDISCGYIHCLALSSDGRVYGWGINNVGQIKCGDGVLEIISTPIEIELNEKIKFIHCTGDMSFAVTFNGNAYYWGTIDLRKEKRILPIRNMEYISLENGFKISIPKLIPIKDVLKFYSNYIMFFILDKHGKLYLFSPFNEEIHPFKYKGKITDLYCQDHLYCLFQFEDCAYQYQDRMLNKTNFTSFYDFYSQNLSYFQKTIEVTKDGYLLVNEIQFNDNNLVLKNKNVFETKYENIFEGINKMGTGGYGVVWEVKRKSNQVHYAIKRLNKIVEFDLNEIKILSKLNTDFVVEYIDSWIEVKVIFRKITRFVFIQMELCSMNLKHFLNLINENRHQIYNYFISCELFKELIECVNYLHSLNPPIIHRDLKLENILISDGINGRFLKLCDFGLAKIHEISVHSENVGTYEYMAPEVRDSENYNTKSDIYSLALIGTQIFNFQDEIKIIRSHENRNDFDIYLSEYLNTNLKKYFITLLDIISKCLLPKDFNARPDCNQLLGKCNEFSIDKNIVLKENITEFESYLKKNENIILKTLFVTKMFQTSENTLNYVTSRKELIDKALLLIIRNINCSAICMTALSFLAKLSEEEKETEISSRTMEQLVEVILVAMQAYPNNQSIQKNAIITISSLHIVNNVIFDYYLCVKLIFNSLVLIKDNEINLKALIIFCNIMKKLTTDQIGHLAININYIMALIENIKKKFNDFRIILGSLMALNSLTNEDDSFPILSRVELDIWINIFKEFHTDSDIIFEVLLLLNKVSYLKEKSDISLKTLEQLTENILTAMSTHPTNLYIQRNALAIISDNYFHENITFNWFICSKLVLNTLVNFKETHLNLMAVYIFYKLISKLTDSELKHIQENSFFIQQLIDIIRKTINVANIDISNECLLVQFALAALSGLTDEYNGTSGLVLSYAGLDLWIKIMKDFNGNIDIIYNLLVVLNNIAQVYNLRTHLIKNEFLIILRQLAKSPDIRVSFHATGILVYLCCDQIIWDNCPHTLSDILNDLKNVVLNWERPDSELVIKTSFLSLSQLLSCYESPVIQLWAVWSIHHLCSKNRKNI